MIILGTGGSDHDFSAALLQDGSLIAATEDERITGVRHGRQPWYQIPVRPSVQYCLEHANMELADVDLIYSNMHLEKRARYLTAENEKNVVYIGHHLSHAAGAFLSSPYKTATAAVIDGAGHCLSADANQVELETISIGRGEGGAVEVSTVQSGTRNVATGFWRYMCTNSIGGFYEAITELIGFGPYGAGKTMGLAAYGDSSMVAALREFVSINPEGRFLFDPYQGFFGWASTLLETARNPFMVRANLAAAAQEIFEEAIFNVLNYAYSQTPKPMLCYSGGCALNTVANSMITSRTPFDKVFIHPAANDAGTAIGAALYGWHTDLGHDREPIGEISIGSIAFSPVTYSDCEIQGALDEAPVFYYRPGKLVELVAQRIADEEIAGWFQGGAEIGPRALGNRSILASPARSATRDRINLSVKNRESFRPLAPMVTEEAAAKYFDVNCKSPFMLSVARVRPEYRSVLAAVTHIDGTARLQTVNSSENALAYRLLEEVDQITGRPILLNTSFNLPGRPIVESPAQAIEAFLVMDLDFLVIGEYVVEKHTPWAIRAVRAR